MNKTLIGALGAIALLACAAPVSAQSSDGDAYTFDLVNSSPWTVLTFQTQRPSGQWSQDWIPTRVVEPGDTVNMRFNATSDLCEYPVRITFTDGDVWEENIDFCDLEYVYVSVNGIETSY